MNNVLHKNLKLRLLRLLAKEQLKFNKENNTGVYQLVNLINGKTYVGSSINLNRRLSEYLNPLYIKRNLIKGNSAIMNALLKYGYINFGIRILEIMEFNSNLSKAELKNNILAKEQYFIDLIKPEYNINKISGSNLGRIYSEEVRIKMSLAKIGVIKRVLFCQMNLENYLEKKAGRL